MKNYKVAYHSGSFYSHDLSVLIPILSNQGYDAIELNGEMYQWELGRPHIYPNMSFAKIAQLVQELKKNKLQVSSISAHMPLLHGNKIQRREAIQYTKKMIDIASYLNVDIVHGLSGKNEEQFSDKDAMEFLAESVNEIINYSNKKNIKFAIENIAGMFINSGRQFKTLQNHITEGKLYLNLDTSNSYIVEEDLCQFIMQYKEDIIHIHIKDAQGTIENFTFPPLGEGNINFGLVLHTLNEIDYRGFISIEYVAHIFGYENDILKIPAQSMDFLRNFKGV